MNTMTDQADTQAAPAGKLNISVEAATPEAIANLLEQALFELRQVSQSESYKTPYYHSGKGAQSGSLGSYRFDYTTPVTDWTEGMDFP